MHDTIIMDNSILAPEDPTGVTELLSYMKKNSIPKAYFMNYYLYEMKDLKDTYLKRFGEIFNVLPAKEFRDVNLYEMTLKKTTSENRHAK